MNPIFFGRIKVVNYFNSLAAQSKLVSIPRTSVGKMHTLSCATFTASTHVALRRSLLPRVCHRPRSPWSVAVRACAARPASPAVSQLNEFPEKERRIRLVACDMDGTILDSKSSISAENVATVKRLLLETDVGFVPATGKSRAGALKAMSELGNFLRQRHPLGVPGVFLQGLVVYGADGNIVYENGVDDGLAKSVADISKRLGLALIAYSGDDIVCAKQDMFTNLLPVYHEPMPRVVGDWKNVIGERTLNKFIFMAEPRRIDKIRPLVQKELQGRAVLTQAQGNMLEVLPLGSSKGDGVLRLLESMDIWRDDVMAIGDAENDLEMLKMVGLSCAVSNALTSVKRTAKITDLPSNDESGVAAAIDRFILSPKFE